MRWTGHGLVAAAALVAGLAGAVTAAAAPHTQRMRFSPFAADGTLRPGLHAVDRVGACFTSSGTVGRRGAYRCITGNLLRDPCFGDAVATARLSAPVVVCVSAPWTATLVRIALDAPPPADPAVPVAGRPRALELGDGARCVFVTGASPPMHGYRLNYACQNGRMLYGLPRTAGATWHIREACSATARTLRLAAIRRAWT